ncbi:MAG: family 10 glycosylhydrolase [Candidatus Marinimicrobia bacterium]|nr:family 10 glycosylhydrolase [Candidatus Neomarinimicrobiota bacterium]MCF7903926.1 family 10 glycosylhydrolase [Candidatus Neomarinimicrobiota bacterium]
MKKSIWLVRTTLTLIVITAILACSTPKPSPAPSPPIAPPAPATGEFEVPREFRAAWVATVANIDWPSKPGLTTEEQKAEALLILDSAAILNLNAIIFQVRPQCDALYESELEPWSYYLTGAQGMPPVPFYDPLEFWVEESHKRGIELHAWFNPYRAHHPKGERNETSIAATRPELVREVDNGYLWMDPTMAGTQNHSFDVIMDVVKRYDIDGVHFDDYFFPYGSGEFPDDRSWEGYQNAGGTMSREDWRRHHVNVFVERVYKGIKAEKPWVKFGISPFGIWRPGNPPSIMGYDQYAKLYADAKLWLNEGWVDYWTPQLYWPTRQIPQSFPVLLGWWKGQNTHDRNLWPGIFTSRIKDEAGANERFSQIMITRGMVPDGPGVVHFSMKALQKNYGGFADILLAGPYKQRALVPPSPWLDNEAPAAPLVELDLSDGNANIHWLHEDKSDVHAWIVYMQRGDNWYYEILTSEHLTLSVPLTLRSESEEEMEMPETLDRVAVTALDRLGNESSKTYISVR